MDEYIRQLELVLVRLISHSIFWTELLNDELYMCRWCRGWGNTVEEIQHQADCPVCDCLELRDQLIKEGSLWVD